jgi:hypothetical protein
MEYARLRRLVPLDERFWKCDALATLSAQPLPPPLTHLFAPDRAACLPPEQPDRTPSERCRWRAQQGLAATFNCTACSALALSLLALTRNSMQCPLTLAVLVLASATLCSVGAGHCIRKMNQIGAGSQTALLCCPVVGCNAIGLFVSLVWSYLLFFTATDADVEVRRRCVPIFHILPSPHFLLVARPTATTAFCTSRKRSSASSASASPPRSCSICACKAASSGGASAAWAAAASNHAHGNRRPRRLRRSGSKGSKENFISFLCFICFVCFLLCGII